MSRHISLIVLSLTGIAAISIASFTFARGGGGGGHDYDEHNSSRREPQRVAAEDRQAAEPAERSNERDAATNSAEHPVANSVITNPFVRGAEVGSHEATDPNRNDRNNPYDDYPYYWGGWGPMWTTNVPPPVTP